MVNSSLERQKIWDAGPELPVFCLAVCECNWGTAEVGPFSTRLS